MLKRLRDSGYTCEKVVGYTDDASIEKQFEIDVKDVFPEGEKFDNELIIKNLKFFKNKFRNYYKDIPSYGQHDQREWTILIDLGGSNIFLTLYRNSKDVHEKQDSFGSDYFELSDGNQWVKPIRKRIHSLSFEVLLDEIIKLGI